MRDRGRPGIITRYSARAEQTLVASDRMARIDANLPLQIAALDASIGRLGTLQGLPREGPESAPKPAFH
jgi:hypothetical protein